MEKLLKIKYLWNTDLLININLRSLKLNPFLGKPRQIKNFSRKLYIYIINRLQ